MVTKAKIIMVIIIKRLEQLKSRSFLADDCVTEGDHFSLDFKSQQSYFCRTTKNLSKEISIKSIYPG